MTRFHKGSDAWGRNSYSIPAYAVAGASDTGTESDSPAPSDRVMQELTNLRGFLREHGIPARVSAYSRSGNISMIKRWVTVSEKDYPVAQKLADEYLKANNSNTRYIHDAY